MADKNPEIDLPVSGIGRLSGAQELGDAESLFDADFFGETTPIIVDPVDPPVSALPKSLLYYSGSFKEVVLKRWDGTAWVNCLFLRDSTEWLPVPNSAPAGPIGIANISVTPNTWGDIRVAWDTTNYTGDIIVKLIDTSDDSVVATTTVTDSEAYFDVEEILPHWGFAPSYFRVTVNADTVTETWENSTATATNDWVKQVIVFGGQSNCEGHLTFLSGTDGRQDLVSAGDIRRAVAAAAGLANAEVMPLNLTYGDSAIDKQANDTGPSGSNYWYDLNTSTDGPRLTSFLSGVAPYADRVRAIIWAQGETDIVASAGDSGRSSTPTRWYDGTVAVFDRIRTSVSAIQAPIIFQTVGRSWWNDNEETGELWQTYRNMQVTLIGDRSDVRLGSWAPGAERRNGYQDDGIHCSSAVFHATAAELADSIINATDRISTPPAWVSYPVLTGITATKSGSNTVMSWNTTGYSKFLFINLSVADGSVLYSGILSTNSYTFTAAAQTAAYGFTSDYADFIVAGYVEATTTQGPGSLFNDLAT